MGGGEFESGFTPALVCKERRKPVLDSQHSGFFFQAGRNLLRPAAFLTAGEAQQLQSEVTQFNFWVLNVNLLFCVVKKKKAQGRYNKTGPRLCAN